MTSASPITLSRAQHIALWLRVAIVAALGLAALPGCASLESLAPTPDVRPQRLARAKQAIESFEAKRDAAQFQAAVAYWQQRNVKLCRESLETLVLRNPKHRDGQLMLLELFLAEDQIEEAVGRAEAIAGFENDAAVQHARGLAYEAAGDDDQAVECFRAAATLSPGNDVYLASLDAATETSDSEEELEPSARVEVSARDPAAALLMAEVCIGLGRRDDARALAEEVLRAQPENALARQTVNRTRRAEPARAAVEPVGLASLDNPIDSDDSLPLLNLSNEPASPSDLARRGAAALAAGAPRSARDLFQKACRAAPNDEQVPTRAAVLALQHDQPELAAQLAEDALSSFPRSSPLYRVLGTAQYRLEHWKSAQTALQKALDLDNTDALAYFLMGSTLSKLRQAEAAEWHYRKARQLDPRYAVGR